MVIPLTDYYYSMSVYLLDDSLWFPSVAEAESDGLLAAGGDLGADRLLLAYNSGIFPWFSEDDELPLWWSPDPRFVLFPGELKVSKSMLQVIKKKEFEFKINTSFKDVICNCSDIKRQGVNGTWITAPMAEAYTRLHNMGYAWSAETWKDGCLAGGLYGVKLGKVFFGESMFSKVSNASKFAFICIVRQLYAEGVQIIDCQLHTPHLESLGARMIPRADFLRLLDEYL